MYPCAWIDTLGRKAHENFSAVNSNHIMVNAKPHYRAELLKQFPPVCDPSATFWRLNSDDQIVDIFGATTTSQTIEISSQIRCEIDLNFECCRNRRKIRR